MSLFTVFAPFFRTKKVKFIKDFLQSFMYRCKAVAPHILATIGTLPVVILFGYTRVAKHFLAARAFQWIIHKVFADFTRKTFQVVRILCLCFSPRNLNKNHVFYFQLFFIYLRIWHSHHIIGWHARLNWISRPESIVLH